VWRFDLEAFLAWLAKTLKLQGGVRPVDERLWQLGSIRRGEIPHECFFRRSGPLSAPGRKRLLAYRNAVLLRALPGGEQLDGFHGPSLSLTELLHQDRGSLTAGSLSDLLWAQAAVRFEGSSGALFLGETWLGEVPVGCKEYHLLARLAQEQDAFVPYADLKRYVLEHAGSADTTDEATFCQKLKSRLKRSVPQIDSLIATTNKGDGYRLRAFATV
jgi:hypothetical protein